MYACRWIGWCVGAIPGLHNDMIRGFHCILIGSSVCSALTQNCLMNALILSNTINASGSQMQTYTRLNGIRS